jgi:hypothetical protein
MQRNVVGDKVTVAVAISQIFKYQQEHGNIKVPKKDPYKQLHCWIVHAKTVSKKIIKEEEGNPQFTMPHLKSLNKLGLANLSTQFKFKDKPTTPKATKKKTVKAPPKAKAPFVAKFLVAPPKKKKKSVAAQTKAAAIFLQPKDPPKKKKVPSPPTRTSPRRPPISITTPHREGSSFHSIYNNPFTTQHTSRPFQALSLASSILAPGLPSPTVTNVALSSSITTAALPTPNVTNVALSSSITAEPLQQGAPTTLTEQNITTIRRMERLSHPRPSPPSPLHLSSPS